MTNSETKCCGGLGLFGKCGRGTKKPCSGLHCKCMNLKGECPDMHYLDCYEHYIHVEHVEDKPYTPPESTTTGHLPPPQTGDWEERFDEIGFGNQALIVGFKRIELKSFISQVEAEARAKAEKRIKKILLELKDSPKTEGNHSYWHGYDMALEHALDSAFFPALQTSPNETL